VTGRHIGIAEAHRLMRAGLLAIRLPAHSADSMPPPAASSRARVPAAAACTNCSDR